ncbi:hypothetical protein [Rummeliibacillus sp. TYF-LIM-RU47]|uniref:hypothetical protein n=1 Tax=unclassified Rummeliibacillus TaxID=2622809 RepID=UPI00123A9024|nr:hypothetical protein [Rummeliibacillus sp. TYF-LIM-RU47]
MEKYLPKNVCILFLLLGGFVTVLGVLTQLSHETQAGSWSWREIVMVVVGIVVYFTFAFTGFYFLIARIKKRGIAWTKRRVSIDFSNHELYWHEIESIVLKKYPGIGKVTTIVTKPEYRDEIQQRLEKRKSAVESFDILWIAVQKPNIMHQEMMKAFKQFENLHRV